MADGLYVASRPMTLKAEVLMVAGKTLHAVRLRPKAVAPVLEEKGMASGRGCHVTVNAIGLLGMAVVAVGLKLFDGDGAMDP